jgi:hypothetical protein
MASAAANPIEGSFFFTEVDAEIKLKGSLDALKGILIDFKFP